MDGDVVNGQADLSDLDRGEVDEHVVDPGPSGPVVTR
jgi:hypothetical protein